MRNITLIKIRPARVMRLFEDVIQSSPFEFDFTQGQTTGPQMLLWPLLEPLLPPKSLRRLRRSDRCRLQQRRRAQPEPRHAGQLSDRASLLAFRLAVQ